MSAKQRKLWSALAVVPLLSLAVSIAGVLVSPAAAASAGTAVLPELSATQHATLNAAALNQARVVTAGGSLNVRSGPATDKSVVATLANGSTVTALCQVWGQQITGTERRSPYWLRIGKGRYVSDGFLRWTPSRPTLAWCGKEPTNAVSATVQADLLNVRTGPGTASAKVGTVRSGTVVDVTCQVWGESVSGVRTTSVWLQVGAGRYLSEAYLRWSAMRPWLPWCGQQPPSVPPSTSSAFIRQVVAPAQAGQRRYGVPASVAIGQAILESGWGRSALTRDDHNHFGMKCFGSPGPVAIGCRDYATHECSGQQCWNTHDEFRVYRDITASFADHGRQLATLSRYATAMRYTGDADRFIREVHRAGYATGSTYADKVINLMREYDLYRYDKLS